MIIMILSSGIFAFIIGDIGRMVSSFNYLADQFREKMNYVERFLAEKSIPLSLRLQIKRYLEYNYQLKKLYKIEESELLSLLNVNLRGKITVYFNGKILQNIDVLYLFPIDFLSNLSFILKKQTFAIDENMVIEDENGSELFFVVNGRVSLIHKKSKTHIIDLDQDKYFGEISFFSELTRQATVKARDFTECLILSRDDFL
jgi:phosphoribosyl-dephospho-CoA transferase